MTTGPQDPGTYRVCGIKISVETAGSAAARIADAARRRRRFEVHLCNAYTLSLVDRDAALRRALAGADMNLPDGAPVAWLGRMAGLRGPVRGPSLVTEVVTGPDSVALRHFLYGGAPGVADAVVAAWRRHTPDVQVAGLECPPFRDLTEEELLELAARIRASDANIVWVGLGTPRQDYLVPLLSRHLDAAVVPVGAAFDFHAGTVREAPAWLRGTGLEWVHRLRAEPRRLWRRYLLGNPRFLGAALRHAFRS